MAITFGLDISHHQDLSLDLAQARRDGCEFVFLKATEGGSMVDSEFSANYVEARSAGMLAAAYCFIRANATAAQHVQNIRGHVPIAVPVILDVETAADGSKPSLAQARACLDAIRAAGYRVPLSYIPIWYWRDVWGRPSLTGWPPLWSSRYPDNNVGTLASEWAQVPASYWTGYGGLDVAVLQFTSSARIAGYQPLDANAFRGTRAELAALLNQEADMPLTQADAGTIFWGTPFDGTNNFAQYLKGHIANLEAGQAGILAAVQAATKDPTITLDAMRQVVNDAVAQHVVITGEVHIGPAVTQ